MLQQSVSWYGPLYTFVWECFQWEEFVWSPGICLWSEVLKKNRRLRIMKHCLIPFENCLMANMEMGKSINETIVWIISRGSLPGLLLIVVLARRFSFTSLYWSPVKFIGRRRHAITIVNPMRKIRYFWNLEHFLILEVKVMLFYPKGDSKVSKLHDEGGCDSAPKVPNDLTYCMQG